MNFTTTSSYPNSFASYPSYFQQVHWQFPLSMPEMSNNIAANQLPGLLKRDEPWPSFIVSEQDEVDLNIEEERSTILYDHDDHNHPQTRNSDTEPEKIDTSQAFQ
ncbi:hypothetical protein CVT24_012728 [Panaeolus cyanescens]|uniref:Uncharacterized protein n=1 Tax=Panaeolus cyanescens TaxID=181874 RepID=A0A409X0K6_9AGAR|nr:hypothetical protein CVT24_012728 [Panaeolus cyanescens]